MILDIIAITLIVLFFIRGYKRGIIIAGFYFLSIVLGIICSLKLSEKLATYLLEQGYVTSGWSQVISYLILLVGVVWAVRLLGKSIDNFFENAMLGWLNKTLGGILYSGFAIAIWSSFLWIGREMNILGPKLITESITYEYIEPVAPLIAEKLGYLWPLAKTVFADLQEFFSNINQYIPDSVDTH